MITEIRLGAARAVHGAICLRPGQEGYNPDGELSSGSVPMRFKAAVTLVERAVANQAQVPPTLNVMVMLPQKKDSKMIPADQIKVIEAPSGGGN